jgi:magnesium-transporting ATPase (P-type)
MDSEYCLVVKGNPKVIWNICTYVLVGGKTVAKYNTW